MKYTKAQFKKVDWFVLGISGGKDSTALLLYMLNEFLPKHKISPDKLLCTFADTGNEAPETHAHVQFIHENLHPVIVLYPKLGFYDLARKKKQFPFKQARFCTQELKLEPSKTFMEQLGGHILSVSGVRADESKERSTYSEFAGPNETYHGFTDWRPLLDWKIEHIWLIHKKYKFPLNPLYAIGFSRVGCFPCIVFANKAEVRILANRYPERIDFLREQENSFPVKNDLVTDVAAEIAENNTRFHNAFPLNKVPKRYRTRAITTKDGRTVMVATIDDVVAWSRTSDKKRGSQFNFHFEDFKDTPTDSAEPSCMAGVCE